MNQFPYTLLVSSDFLFFHDSVVVGDSQSKEQGSGSTSGSQAAAGVLPVGMVTGGWKISSWAHTGQWRPVLGVRLELWVCCGIPHAISIKKRKCVKTQVVPSSSAIWSTHVTFYQVRNRKNTGNGAFVFWETTCEAKWNMQVFIFLSYFMNRNWKMPRARNSILSLLPNPRFFFFHFLVPWVHMSGTIFSKEILYYISQFPRN